MNGIPPSQWLRKSSQSPVTIQGTKNFLGELNLENNVNANALFSSQKKPNSNILQALDDVLLHGVNQTVQGPTSFWRLLSVQRVDCPAPTTTLDRIPVPSLLLRTGDQVVESPTHFETVVNFVGANSPQFRNLTVGTLNGQNFTKDVEDTLRTFNKDNKGTQVIQGKYDFDGGFIATEIQTDGTVDELDLGKLMDSLVRKDRPRDQLVSFDDLSFSEGLSVQSFTYNGVLNSLPSSSWGNSWLLSSLNNQTVFTPTLFEDGLLVEDGFWHTPLDVRGLHDQTIRIDRDNRLGGLVMDGPLQVASLHLSPTATLNGVNVKRQGVTKGSNNVRDKSFLLINTNILLICILQLVFNSILEGQEMLVRKFVCNFLYD